MESDAPKSLLPKLRINDLSVREDQQQCVLRCSRAAFKYQKKQKDPNPEAADRKLWMEKTALVEANTRKRCVRVCIFAKSWSTPPKKIKKKCCG